MKTKRFLSTLLALLLICSLPVSAFAMGDNPAGTTVTEIHTGEVMNSNSGTVTTNNGTVTTNNGTVTDNYYLVQSNYGTVANNGTEENNDKANVSKNYGTITTNEGKVDFNGTISNHENAIVDTNTGTVYNNYGTVANNGTEDNNLNAKVTSNKGTVTTNTGTITTNGGTVTTNNGTVTTNNGTVTTNKGNVDLNQLIIETNNGYISVNEGEVKTNNGTVDTNATGVIINNGTVNDNQNVVRINNTTGTVINVAGDVLTNYGTVKQGDTTWYGVLVDNDGTETLEQHCMPGQKLDFSQLTKEGYVYAGYTQAYGMENGKVTLLPSPITVNETSYTVTCPNVLTLIWQAIVIPGSGENTAAAGETAAAADDGAGYFGPGSRIAINGRQYLLVAVVEDVYCLASIDSFEDEELSDLPALLASLLTEEQLSHVTGEPELLDEALTARFFAGEGSHIVFPCDSSLIFS